MGSFLSTSPRAAAVLTFAAFAAATALGACGDGAQSPGVSGAPPEFADSPPRTDPAMGASERSRLESDLALIPRLAIDGSRIRFFRQAYGGTDGASVARFVAERVRYVLPRGVRLEDRVEVVGADVDPAELTLEQDPDVLAQNVGTPLWFLREALRPARVTLRFGDERIEITSSRVGIIALGPGYTGEVPELTRVATQVHEARHSDCTGGLEREDLARVAAGGLPSNAGCGHLHADCPAGHPLAGLAACDGHPWGAYAIELLYSLAVADTCRGCTGEQREVARATALDAASRVLQLERLVDGDFGAPDVSSAGVRD